MKSDDQESELPQTLQFQLIPVSENPKQPAIGEVIERKIQEGVILSIGRQVIKDGHPVIKGNNKLSEENIWLNSKVVSRTHAELWMKDHQIYVRDIGSSSGTFLNKMRLSPSGKESRPYAVKQDDILQFGVDFRGKTENIYKSIIVKIGFHDQSWIKASRNNANHIKFKSALKSLLSATNPYSSVNTAEPTDDEENSTDCCICIGPIAPYQALFVAPCSHCFHFKCVSQMVIASPMFQCPLCRQVANLTASVSTESLVENSEDKQNRAQTPINQENEIKSPDSDGISYAYMPANTFDNLRVDRRETFDENPGAIGAQNTWNDDASDSGRRMSSRKNSDLKRPSLSQKLAELLGRSSLPSNSTDANPKSDQSNSQSSMPTRLTPRSETPHFTRPASSNVSRIDSEESIS